MERFVADMRFPSGMADHFDPESRHEDEYDNFCSAHARVAETRWRSNQYNSASKYKAVDSNWNHCLHPAPAKDHTPRLMLSDRPAGEPRFTLHPSSTLASMLRGQPFTFYPVNVEQSPGEE